MTATYVNLKGLLTSILVCIILHSLQGQYQQIGGDTLNSYYGVEAVYPNYVQCFSNTDLSDLHPGDKVVLIQHSGMEVDDGGDFFTDPLSNLGFGNAGKYEMLAVDTVNNTTKRVSFSVTLDIANYTNNEQIQLVKIYTSEYADVISELTVPAWNDTIGGVLAMVVFKKLKLNADINVSGKGYSGGDVETDYDYGCRTCASGIDTFYYLPSATKRAGMIGGSNVSTSFQYTKGHGNVVIGGGGGIGQYGGGAGGGNADAGGIGGRQSPTDGCSSFCRALGGIELSGFHIGNRISFGGGGGGTTETSIDHPATPGGNGGGIILILADTLEANGHGIFAYGDSVNAIADAGGGGGGAGGTVLLDINYYSNDVDVIVTGGKGGNTSSYYTSAGPGGGGGGGCILVAQSTKPSQVLEDYSGGYRGEGADGNNGFFGEDGRLFTNLKLPLNGFLFNTLVGIDTICAGTLPDTIIGSMPKGGETAYSYTWLQKLPGGSWSAAIGSGDSLHFQPDILHETTIFTRVINSGDIWDTAAPVQVFAYDSLDNNLISTDSSRYCWGDTPLEISGSDPIGGDGNSYEFTWLSRLVGDEWSVINTETDTSYTPSVSYEDTLQLARVVESGTYWACIDTSNVLQIDVIPQIINNLESNSENICANQVPLPFTETMATGGAGVGTFTYFWEQQPDGVVSWSAADGINTNESYTPETLINSTNFRRNAISEICTTYSNTISITAYPLIEQNTVVGAPVQYTCYNTGKELAGSEIIGGKPAETPRYMWEHSVDTLSWNPSEGMNTAKDYSSVSLTDSLYFHRIVYSGEADQCIDTSVAVLIRINQLPTGDLVTGYDTACSDGSVQIPYEGLTGSSPWSMQVGLDQADAVVANNITAVSGIINYPVEESGTVILLDLIDDSLCHANLSLMTGARELKVHDYPNVNAGTDDEVCGTEYTLQAIPDGEHGTWMPGPFVLSDSTSPVSIVEVDDFSESVFYSFVWNDRNWHCNITDTVEIEFFEKPDKPDLGEDVVLDNVFHYSLLTDEPIGQGWWSVTGPGMVTFAANDTTNHDTEVEFQFPVTGDYHFVWHVDNGVCQTLMDTLVVTVGEVEFFDGFSPNGDGINDEYIINLSGLVPAQLTILDRWGIEVNHIDGIEQIIWDGTNFKGDDMPEGSYILILEQEGVSNGKKGRVIQLRK